MMETAICPRRKVRYKHHGDLSLRLSDDGTSSSGANPVYSFEVKLTRKTRLWPCDHHHTKVEQCRYKQNRDGEFILDRCEFHKDFHVCSRPPIAALQES